MNHTASFVFLEVNLGPVQQVTLFVCVAIIVVSLLKTIWHATHIARYLPDSLVVMSLGLGFGAVLWSLHFSLPEAETFNQVFFGLLLPLIIFSEAYFANPVHIFSGFQLVVILLHATLGTVINSLCTGALIYASNPLFVESLSLVECFMFGSLISATDPVSVMAVLEEVKADQKLQYLIGGGISDE